MVNLLNILYVHKAITDELLRWDLSSEACLLYYKIQLAILTASWTVKGTPEHEMNIQLLNLKVDDREYPYTFFLVNDKVLAWHKLPAREPGVELRITPEGINGRPLSYYEFPHCEDKTAVVDYAKQEIECFLLSIFVKDDS